jgi:molybdenum cofactor cytidylyltransferase
MIFAVLPACGHSVRMGQPKLSLQLGNRTVIERVVLALRSGGADHIVVVVGPHVPELVPLASSAGGEVLVLPAPTQDMRETVVAGLAHLEERFHPLPTDWWLLTPADHATLSPAVIHKLRAAADMHTHCIIIPTHHGQRGHPTLLSWQYATAIRAQLPGRGINALIREYHRETLELDVSDPEVLSDLDTPQDYLRLDNMIRLGNP